MIHSVSRGLKAFLILLNISSGIVYAAEIPMPHSVTALVRLETGLGPIEIELYGESAPLSVANFLRHVEGGYFDDAEFYRVVTYANDNGNPKIEVIQGGLNERESPFPPIRHESTEQTGILHTDGVLSMARGGVGTASSEFFICIDDQPGLDFGQPRNEDGQGFAAFGKVVSGMEIVKMINKASPGEVTGEGYTAGQVLLNPVKILRAVRI